MSLRPTGTPVSAPILSPCWMACSQRLAAARAPCRSTLTHACNVGSKASRRVRQAVTTSTGETSRRCTSAATSATPSVCNVVMAMLPYKRLTDPHPVRHLLLEGDGNQAKNLGSRSAGTGVRATMAISSAVWERAGRWRSASASPHKRRAWAARVSKMSVVMRSPAMRCASLLGQTQLAFPNNIKLNLIRAPGNAIASSKEALKRPVSIGYSVLGTLIKLRVGTQYLFGDLHRAHIHTREGQFLNRAFRTRRFPTQLFGERT